MTSGGTSTTQAAGGPKAAPPPLQNQRVEQKSELNKWWKTFKKGDRDKKAREIQETQGTHTQVRQFSCLSTTPLHTYTPAHDHPLPCDCNRKKVLFIQLGHQPGCSLRLSRYIRATSDEVICTAPQGIFGVPLQNSIRYANVAISLINEEGESYIYGYVPIVVAKCGVYLKEKGEVEISATRACDVFLTGNSDGRRRHFPVSGQ